MPQTPVTIQFNAPFEPDMITNMLLSAGLDRATATAESSYICSLWNTQSVVINITSHNYRVHIMRYVS